MDIGQTLKDLNMTADEMKSLTKAFKDEKFRDMLNDYVQEISDPENRRIYEEEIAILEKERGNNIEFIHPKPFRSLRTNVNRKQKCYINICANDKVGKPECKRGVSEDGRSGQCWSLPHNLLPGRQDIDPKGNKIMIYDVIFHPDTLHIANKKAEFMQMVISTAVQGIQDAFKVTLDKNKLREMNTTYKGTPQPCVIRKPIPGYTAKPPEDDPLAFPYPDENKTKPMSSKINYEKSKVPTEPSYTVKYRSFIDLQDFRCSRDSGKSPRPKEIVVTIDVPLLKSVANANLEVKEKSLLLESENPAYKLELPLSYPVDEEGGEAKFIKQRGQLTITLPVLPSNEAMEFCWGNKETEGGIEEAEESRGIEKEVTTRQETVDGEGTEDIGEEEQLNGKEEEENRFEEKRKEYVQENGEENVIYIKESLVNLDGNTNTDPVKEGDVLQKIDSNRENSPLVPTEPSSGVKNSHVDSCSDSSAQISKDADTLKTTDTEEEVMKDEDSVEGDEPEMGEQEEGDISEEEHLTVKRTCEQEENRREEVEEDTQETGEHDVLRNKQSQVNLDGNESRDPVRDEEQLTGKRREDAQESGEQDALRTQESQTNLSESKNKAQMKEDTPQRIFSPKNPASVNPLQIPPAPQDEYLHSSTQVKNDYIQEIAETKDMDVKMEISLKTIKETNETPEESIYIPEESTPISMSDEARVVEEEDDLPEKEIIQKPETDNKPPPASLREIDQDGNETVFSDHATSAGFLFQNSLMYELD
ncbi:protein kintoun [Festucalex cinctus]